MGIRKEEIFTTTGTMGCGKTEFLLERIRRAKLANLGIIAVYPDIAERRKPNTINSANGVDYPAVPIPVACPEYVLNLIDKNTHVVALDEAQFFPEDLVQVCRELQARGVRVYAAGLDRDFRGDPFGRTIGQLMSVSYEVLKLHAVCMNCKKEEASIPQRLVKNSHDHWVPAPKDAELVAVGNVVSEGENENGHSTNIIYQSRCLNCHELPEYLDES